MLRNLKNPLAIAAAALVFSGCGSSISRLNVFVHGDGSESGRPNVYTADIQINYGRPEKTETQSDGSTKKIAADCDLDTKKSDQLRHTSNWKLVNQNNTTCIYDVQVKYDSTGEIAEHIKKQPDFAGISKVFSNWEKTGLFGRKVRHVALIYSPEADFIFRSGHPRKWTINLPGDLLDFGVDRINMHETALYQMNVSLRALDRNTVEIAVTESAKFKNAMAALKEKAKKCEQVAKSEPMPANCTLSESDMNEALGFTPHSAPTRYLIHITSKAS